MLFYLFSKETTLAQLERNFEENPGHEIAEEAENEVLYH